MTDPEPDWEEINATLRGDAEPENLNGADIAPESGGDIARRIAEKSLARVKNGATENAGSPANNGPTEFVDKSPNSPFSPNSPAGYMQGCIVPDDSVLGEWRDYAVTVCEGADCYLAGAMLPIVAAMLGRRVWHAQAVEGGQFPNIFSLVVGPPGDRKSTTIKLAAKIARAVMPSTAFLPANFSPETLFDEYDIETGGQPDKLWIADDANSVLADWKKSSNGERSAARFLELYDCGPLSERFRRNSQGEKDGDTQRAVRQTSTSIVFGATFNIAAFQGQSVRSGMARRFLYYVADRRARRIDFPESDPARLDALAKRFRPLLACNGGMRWSPDAARRWSRYRSENEDAVDALSLTDEDMRGRLGSAPKQVMAVSLLFECCRWATRPSTPFPKEISIESLECAIAHVGGCVEAFSYLNTVRDRKAVESDAELLLEKVRRDFADHYRDGKICVSRSKLTSRYANNSSRAGSWTPDDLYLRLIPALERQGLSTLEHKDGRLEVYAFKPDFE